MTLRFEEIYDRGVLDKERVVLVAEQDMDIGKQIVVAIGDALDRSLIIDSGYWFPNIDVKTGDFVVLYTKAGQVKTKQNESGTTSHFFYFGRNEPYWALEGDLVAAVLNVDTWRWHVTKEATMETEE